MKINAGSHMELVESKALNLRRDGDNKNYSSIAFI